MSDTYIDLTLGEILVLTERLGIGLPVPISGSLAEFGMGSMPEEVVVAERASGTAISTGRGILEPSGEVNEAVAEVLAAAEKPHLLMIATLTQDLGAEIHTVMLAPGLGLHQQFVAPTVLRFTPFHPREALLRALRITGLRPTDQPSGDPVTVTNAMLEDVLEATRSSAADSAVETLVGAGAETKTAHAFVDALSDWKANVDFVTIYRPDESSLAGGAASWIDTGRSGVWVVESDPDNELQLEESASDSIRIVPSSGRSLADEIAGFLPPQLEGSDLTPL